MKLGRLEIKIRRSIRQQQSFKAVNKQWYLQDSRYRVPVTYYTFTLLGRSLYIIYTHKKIKDEDFQKMKQKELLKIRCPRCWSDPKVNHGLCGANIVTEASYIKYMCNKYKQHAPDISEV